MTSPAVTHGTDSVATVRSFLDALSRLDTDAALALLAEDVVYQNVSLPKAHGKPESAGVDAKRLAKLHDTKRHADGRAPRH